MHAARLPRKLPIEPCAFALCVLVVFGAYAWLARFGIDLVDEGYFMDLAGRVMHGQLPYRDFDTYYTPGLFYLDAAVFGLFGVSVIPARLVMIGIRVGCEVLLYRLGRRVMPPVFAALPPLVLAAMDLSSESHPGWPALLGTLLMVDALAACTTSRARLVLAGVAAGLAFAFKQNVGAFALLGGIGYLVLQPRAGSGGAVLVARLAYAAGVLLAVRWLLAPAYNELLAVSLWLPLLATIVLLMRWRGPVTLPRTARAWAHAFWVGADSLMVDGAWFALGAAAISAAWVLPLVAALGIDHTPFALFTGDVQQGALAWPLDGLPLGAPTLAFSVVWLTVGLAAVLRRPDRRLLGWLLAASLVSLLVLLLPTRAAALDPLTIKPEAFPRLDWLDLEYGSLYLYLPALAAWGGVLVLLRRLAAGCPRPPPAIVCYLLVGVLAELAFYPRADTTHAILAGAPLLIVGAWVLWCVHRSLSKAVSDVGQAALFGALLLVPAAAAGPHLYLRYLGLAHPEPVASAPAYVSLDLERAPVLVAQPLADDLRGVVDYIQQGTPPGQAFFAYPVDPLANVLVDRPNPTRFDHLMPGALSAGDLLQVVEALQSSRPRYILWDHAAVVFWNTDRPNRLLSDYIWRCYRQVATFHLFLILERASCD
jgi:hypothetical protein